MLVIERLWVESLPLQQCGLQLMLAFFVRGTANVGDLTARWIVVVVVILQQFGRRVEGVVREHGEEHLFVIHRFFVAVQRHAQITAAGPIGILPTQ